MHSKSKIKSNKNKPSILPSCVRTDINSTLKTLNSFLFYWISMMCARSPICINTNFRGDHLRILFTIKFISLKCFLINPNANKFRIVTSNFISDGDREVEFQLKCGCFQPELGILQPKWTKQEHCSSHYLVWILDFSTWILLYQLSYVWTMEKRFKCERLSLEHKLRL